MTVLGMQPSTDNQHQTVTAVELTQPVASHSSASDQNGIHVLPPELLIMVFMIAALNRKSALAQGQLRGYNLPLCASVAHVCHYWREVALGCPQLWTMLEFPSVAYTKELLARTKMAPLMVYADLNHVMGDSLPAVQLAMHHISRITEIDIQAPSGWIKSLAGQLTAPAPLLERLSLHGSDYRYRYAQVNDQMFSGVSPRLRSVSFHRCYPATWHAAWLNNLVHLDVCCVSNDLRYDISHWLDVLERMPMVESVALKGSTLFLSPSAIVDLPGPRIVYLRHLRCLKICMIRANDPLTAFDLASFLDHLAISSLSHMEVMYGANTQYDSMSVGPIFPAFARLCHGQQDVMPIKNVYIMEDRDNLGFLKILGWTEPQGNFTMRWVQESDDLLPIVDMWVRAMKSPRFHLGFPYDKSSSAAALQAMTLALETLPLSDVTSLTVDYGYNQSWWSNSHPFFPRLEELTIAHDSVETFLRAFAITRPCPAHGDDPTTDHFLNDPSGQQLETPSTHDGLIFPQLRCLLIYIGDSWLNLEPFMDSFIHTLITRRERGGALERLDLIDCDTLEGVSMRRLREVVPVVFRGQRVKVKSGIVVQELLENEYDDIVHGRELRSGRT